jgi:hypothetical protein
MDDRVIVVKANLVNDQLTVATLRPATVYSILPDT